jgi:hypothetical protein
MAMAMFETPDDRYTLGDITPSWRPWSYDSTEMKFNETSAGVPDVHTITTSDELRIIVWRTIPETIYNQSRS